MNQTGFTHESQKIKSVEWHTPPWIFEKLNLEFDLDPCQPQEGISWIPVKQRYSLQDDGLKQKWFGRVWLNPPYETQTPAWLKLMHGHRNGIALVFSRTDCKWFHNYIAKADSILFLKTRVKFVNSLGFVGEKGAGSGSLLAAWGAENTKALETISNLGYFIKNKGD